MDREQKEFLQKRMKVAASSQPELHKLKRVLLKFGGTFLVPPSEPDQHLSELLICGFLMRGTIVMKPGRQSECHRNVSRLWTRGRRKVVGLATGYALSSDGLWRQHSWALLRDGIIETTESRTLYFGLLFQEGKADQFAAENES